MGNVDIYLDNSATTRIDSDVMDMMTRIAEDYYANPSSIHGKGVEAEKVLKTARADLSGCLGVKTGKIIFTSGGTESNNLAIKGYLSANVRKGKMFVTTRIEHPSIGEQMDDLTGQGINVEFVRTDSKGIIDIDSLKQLINENTALVSIIYVNNETGVIQPIDEIAAIIKRINPETVFHTDAVQAFGKIPVNPVKSGIDMVTMSAHKINGPKGVGALYVREGIRLHPILSGGGQEFGLRSGTENLPGIFGFVEAAKKATVELNERFMHVTECKKKFMEIIEDEKTKTGMRLISPDISSPYILNISFPGLKAETIVHKLETEGIYVSTGSACHSKRKIRSHVLKAMGLPDEVVDGATRVSFSYENRSDEVIAAAKALNAVIIDLRRLFDKRGLIAT